MIKATDIPHCPTDRPLAVFGDGGSVIVAWSWLDVETWNHLRRYRWWLTDGYAWRSTREDDGRKSTISQHREVMGLGNGDEMEVDHIDRCRLHNCKTNLRIVNRWENETNKPRDGAASRFTGVSLDRRTGRWKAQANLHGRYVYLGTYDTEEAAAAARWSWEDMVGRQRWNQRVPMGHVDPNR